jgi:WD40 repeat protein
MGPDGQVGAVEPGSAADSVQVFVWDALTGKNLLKFNAVDGFVPSPEPGFNSYGFRRSFAVAPDGLTLFTESQDDRLAAYDLVSGKKRFGIDAFITEKGVFKYPVAEMAITDDGRMLLALKHGEVAAFDPKTGSEIWRRRAGEQAGYFTLAIDPDGKRFAIGCGDGRILTCETATGAILKGPSDSSKAVATVAVAKDGRTAYTAGFSGDVLKWDISTGKEISRTHLDLPVPKSNFRTANFSPDLRTFFGTVSLRKDLNACLFDTATGKVNARLELEAYKGSHAAMPPVAWLPDGGIIATDGTDQAFRFDREGRKKQTFLAEGNRETMAVAISPDARILVLAGAPTVPPPQPIPGAQVAIPQMRPTGGWISLFEIASGKPLGTHQWPGEFSRACFTPDGRNVILGSYVFGNGRGGVPGTPKANALVLFDLSTGQLHTPFECPDHVDLQRRIDGVAIAPNGYQLAVLEFGDGSIMDSITLYELASGAIRKRFHGHRNMINDLAFTPDGLKLITVSEDVTGLVWDTAPPKPSGPGGKSDKERQKQWETLLSLNGRLAYRAMGELAADPSGTLAFLKAKLRAMPSVIDAELEKHEQPAKITGKRLRERRAVELLEIIGTPEARALLKGFAESGDSALARDAVAAVKRMVENNR